MVSHDDQKALRRLYKARYLEDERALAYECERLHPSLFKHFTEKWWSDVFQYEWPRVFHVLKKRMPKSVWMPSLFGPYLPSVKTLEILCGSPSCLSADLLPGGAYQDNFNWHLWMIFSHSRLDLWDYWSSTLLRQDIRYPTTVLGVKSNWSMIQMLLPWVLKHPWSWSEIMYGALSERRQAIIANLLDWSVDHQLFDHLNQAEQNHIWMCFKEGFVNIEDDAVLLRWLRHAWPDPESFWNRWGRQPSSFRSLDHRLLPYAKELKDWFGLGLELHDVSFVASHWPELMAYHEQCALRSVFHIQEQPEEEEQSDTSGTKGRIRI